MRMDSRLSMSCLCGENSEADTRPLISLIVYGIVQLLGTKAIFRIVCFCCSKTGTKLLVELLGLVHVHKATFQNRPKFNKNHM